MTELGVNNLRFYWNVINGTADYSDLLMPTYGVNKVDILHIKSTDKSGFEIAIRIDGENHRRHLSTLLVIGDSFPSKEHSVEVGYLLRLRPKLSRLIDGVVDSATVERVIQWCLSDRFKAVRINTVGGDWVGYGD